MPHLPSTSQAGRKILSEIRTIRPFLNATLSVVKKRCGNPQCRCVSEGAIHTAALLTWKDSQQTTHTLSVPKDLVEEVSAWVEEGKRLKELMRQMSEAQRDFLISIRRPRKG